MNQIPTIGGTMIAAICGVHPYVTPFDAWLRLTGQVQPKEENQAMYWGTRLEAVVADEFALRNNVKVITPNPAQLVHPVHAFLTGTPDRYIDGVPEGLEVKTAGARSAHRWGDGIVEQDAIPDEYLCQVHWYIHLRGADLWHVAVLIGGQEYRQFRIQPDAEFEGLLEERALKFWRDFVETGKAPEMTYSETAAAWVKEKYSRETSVDVRTAQNETEEAAVWAFWKAKQDLAKAEEAEKIARLGIQHVIGDTAGIQSPLGRVTWKAIKDSTKTDWETLALEMNPTLAMIQKHTKTVPGPRVLRAKWAKDTEEGKD